MKLPVAAFLMSMATPCLALDNGPKVVGCDYQMKGLEQQTDSCLIIGEGLFSGGVHAMGFRIGTDSHTYIIEDREARIYKDKDINAKPIWTGAVELTRDQCRPAGVETEVIEFANGMTVCLYRN